MKANEYITKYHQFLSGELKVYDGQPDDALLDNLDAAIGVCHLLIVETKTLFDARGCKTSSAVEAIFREQDQKWRAILKRLNNQNLEPLQFRLYVQNSMPVTAIALGW